MQWSLIHLLDQVQQDGAVVLYLSEGFSPIFLLPSKPDDASLPSAALFPVEGPTLTRDDLRRVLAMVGGRGYTWDCGYEGLGGFRYRNGTCDFDVSVFILDESCRIEFPRPEAYLRKT